MASQHISTNTFGCAKWIVSSDPTQGTHTTITSAIASASSGDDIFIRPGTYSEGVIVQKSGVNLTAFTCDPSNPTVQIVGQLQFTGAGSNTISNIAINSTTNSCIQLAGSTNQINVVVNNCFFSNTITTGVFVNSGNSSTNSSLIFNNCNGLFNASSTNIFSLNSPIGLVEFNFCIFKNTAFITWTLSNSQFTIRSSEIWGGVLADINALNCYIENSYIYNGNGTGSNGYAFRMDSTSGNTTTVFSNNSIYYGNSSTVSAIILDITGSGTCVFNSNNDYIFTNFTTAVTKGGGGGTASLIYSALSTNVTIPYDTSINTVTPNTMVGGFYYGNTFGNTQTTCLGQQIRSYIDSGSAVSLTNNTAANITNISLTPGIWDVSCVAAFSGTITGTQTTASISSTTATLSPDTGDATVSSLTVPTAVTDVMLTIPSYRVTLATTTTYYLVVREIFTLGTATAYGRISATRVG